MNRRFLYFIEGFQPPSELSRPGGFGFSVYLDIELARKAFERTLPEKSPLIEIGRDIIRGYDLPMDLKFFEPYSFVAKGKDLSCFVRSFNVPGSACGLDIDWAQIKMVAGESTRDENFVGYYPHNVDYTQQASALLSLFTKWANTMASVLDLEYTEPITPKQP